MGKRILLVEDEKELTTILSLILTKAGYEVSVSNDGSDLFRASEDLPDLILLDKHLQNKNGLEICRRLKSDPKRMQIIIIILSGVSFSESDLAHSRADGFLTKPFEIQELLSLLAGYLT